MRIAWFHSHLLHADSGGTRFVFETIEALHRTYGHDVTLYCDVASPASLSRAEGVGARVITLDDVSTNSARYWLTLPARIRNKRARLRDELTSCDLAIASMFPMNWLIEGLDLPKLQVCYEPFAFFYDKKYLSSLKFHERAFFALAAMAYARDDKRAVHAMDGVVTVNVANAEKIERVYDVRPNVVYAGVDTRSFVEAPPDDVRQLRERYRGEPLLLHSTDLSGTKGTIPFLAVFKRLLVDYPEARLLITVYVGDAARVVHLRKVIAKLDLTAAVDVLGCLPHSALPTYYSAADFVCQPSLDQPASWPLRESLMCGTPIVGGIESEEVVDGINGCRIDVTDAGQSARALADAVRGRDRLEPRASGETIRTRFSRERCAAEFERTVRAATQREAAR